MPGGLGKRTIFALMPYVMIGYLHFRRRLVRRANLVIQALTVLLFAYGLAFVWRTLYENEIVEPEVAIGHMVTYAILGAVIRMSWESGNVYDVNWRIRSGDVIGELTKPINWQLSTTAELLGRHRGSATHTHRRCPGTGGGAVRASGAGLTHRRDSLPHQPSTGTPDLLGHHLSPGVAGVQGGLYPRLPTGPVQHLRVPRRFVRAPLALPVLGRGRARLLSLRAHLLRPAVDLHWTGGVI